MSLVRRSMVTAALALGLGAGSLAAQVPHSKDFQWTVGGQAGLMLLDGPDGSSTELPLAGIQTVIRARRTALLLSVQQAFGDQEATAGYSWAVYDADDVLVESGVVPVSYDWVRKYSAALVAFPIRGHFDPYFGIGGGIMQIGAMEDGIAEEMAATGFGSLIGGLELSAGRFMVFGEYQLTTAPRRQYYEERGADGSRYIASSRFISSTTHSLTAGMRISLGGVRDKVGSDGL